jgi:hypothetical protein
MLWVPLKKMVDTGLFHQGYQFDHQIIRSHNESRNAERTEIKSKQMSLDDFTDFDVSVHPNTVEQGGAVYISGSGDLNVLRSTFTSGSLSISNSSFDSCEVQYASGATDIW